MRKPKSVDKDSKGVTVRISKISPTLTEGIIEITHSQSVKQSLDWQSAECFYSAKIACLDNPKAISRSIRKLEKVVENALVQKVQQQEKLLAALSKNK